MTAKKGALKKGASLPGEVTGKINGFPIRRVRVRDLQPAGYNPRKISKTALSALKTSVETFGLTQPAVWNKRFQRLVGGHQRIKGLDPNAYTEVVEVDLDEEREKALNLALNNPHAAGEWTGDLGELLRELDEALPDLSLELAFGDLLQDVPGAGDVDELLEEVEEHEPGKPRETTPEGEGPDEGPRSSLRQIVLVYSPEDHKAVEALLKRVSKTQGLDNNSAAVLWALQQVVK